VADFNAILSKPYTNSCVFIILQIGIPKHKAMRFILTFVVLFLLSVITRFPAAPYTATAINGDAGSGSVYTLELMGISINLAFAFLLSLALTASWHYLRNRS
jgi:hypothetical protein